MRAVMRIAGFPIEAQNQLLSDWDVLCASDTTKDFLFLLSDYASNTQISLSCVQEALCALSEKTNIHVYSLCMLFCIEFAKIMETEYKKNKIPPGIFKSTIADFKYKLMECHAKHGIWGTFVFCWYENIFRLKCFGIGRLEFEKIPLPFSYEDEYVSLAEGSPVINVHIPSGSPLSPEACMDSFRRAYAFFGFSGIMPVYCHSWLLFPAYRNLFAPNSNLANFVDMFRMIKVHKTEHFDDFWRVFDTDDIDSVVPKTSLQKQMLYYIKTTPSFGLAEGICLFDGRKILK